MLEPSGDGDGVGSNGDGDGAFDRSSGDAAIGLLDWVGRFALYR